MTIHKAKGLGFDVVILPEIPDDGIPQSQYFEVAEGPMDGSPKHRRNGRAPSFPNCGTPRPAGRADQRYEAFCMLYVALTRAKRGLYVLLEPPPKSRDPDKPSLANWLARSVDNGSGGDVIYQAGTPDWTANVPDLDSVTKPATHPAAGLAIPRRARSTPSGAKPKEHAPTHSATGMIFGSEVHEVLETCHLDR